MASCLEVAKQNHGPASPKDWYLSLFIIITNQK